MSRNAMWAGRRRENRRGREWRKLERTGRKEGEGRGRKLEETEEEAEEKRNRTGNGENQNRGRVLSRGDMRGRGRRTNLEAV